MNPSPDPHSNQSDTSTTVPLIIYVLYLINLLVPFTGVIGLILAYIYRGEGDDIETHYQYQIRTFWIGLLYGFIAFILTTIVIGWFLFILLILWLVIRCVKGLRFLSKKQAVPSPKTWLI